MTVPGTAEVEAMASWSGVGILTVSSIEKKKEEEKNIPKAIEF